MLDPARRSAAPQAAAASWLQPQRQILLFAGFCALAFLIRIWGSTALKLDDALETYRSQSVEWIYVPTNPPLYTWLLSLIHEVMGRGLHASMTLNYALLIGTFAFVLLSARRMFDDHFYAALTAWSLLLIRQFTRANFTMTHSILLMFFCAFGFWMFLVLLDRPRPSRAIGVGSVLGLGLLSKFNFAAFLASLLLAALASPPARKVAASPLALWLLAGLLVVVGPFAAVYSGAGFDLIGVAEARIDPAGEDGYASRVLAGLASAATGIGAFSGILAVALAITAPRALLRPPRLVTAGDPALIRLVSAMALAALALVLAGVFSGLVSRVSERYLHPFLLVPVPILAAAWLRAAAPGWRALKRFIAIIAAFAAGVLLLLALEMSPLCPQACRDQVPYAGLAERLRDAGFTGEGTIVAGSPIIAGNLVVRFPEARVWLAGSPYEPPARPTGAVPGQCLIVWQEADGGTAAAPPAALAHAGLAPDRAITLTRRVMVPSARPFIDWRDPGAGFAPRRHLWRFILLEPRPRAGGGRCR